VTGAFTLAVLGSGVAMVVLAAWTLSLLLAVELATDAVGDLRAKAQQWKPAIGLLSAPGDSSISGRQNNWYYMVQRPALELAHVTLPALSAWARAMTSTFVCWWLYAALSLPLALALLRSHADLSLIERHCVIVTVVASFVLPCLLLYAPASVSTATNSMLDEMNELCVRAGKTDQCENHDNVWLRMCCIVAAETKNTSDFAAVGYCAQTLMRGWSEQFA
jgi:hypothetical protein